MACAAAVMDPRIPRKRGAFPCFVISSVRNTSGSKTVANKSTAANEPAMKRTNLTVEMMSKKLANVIMD